MFVGSTFLAKNTKGIAKGPKTKPIIAQKVLFEPLLAAIKYNNPAKQIEITNRTKYPIAKPFHIQGTIRLFMPSVVYGLMVTLKKSQKESLYHIPEGMYLENGTLLRVDFTSYESVKSARDMQYT